MQQRATEAALTCIARVGVAKTTIDDIAREAGCSRATLYRYFESKDALLAATLRSESERFGRSVRSAAAGADDLEGALVAMILETHRWFSGHRALRTVLDNDRDLVLTHLSFEGATPVLDAGAGLIASACAPYLDETVARRFGEWCTRIVLSHLLSPSERLSLGDPEAVTALVRDFLVPAQLDRRRDLRFAVPVARATQLDPGRTASSSSSPHSSSHSEVT